MFCHLCYETVQHVCSAKGEKKEEKGCEHQEWYQAWSHKGQKSFSRCRECEKSLDDLLVEAAARARARTLREVEERMSIIEKSRGGRSYDIEDMRGAIQAMKGEGV